MEKVSARASLRLLRFLFPAPHVTAMSFGSVKTEQVLLTKPSGEKFLTTSNTINALHRAALIELTEDTCRLTKAGERKLKRIKGGDLDFAAQHREQAERDINLNGGIHTVTVNHNESVLTRLRRRKASNGKPWLDDEHVEAGERLRRDFTMGQLMQKVTSSWDAAIGSTKSGRGGKADLSDSAIDARDRMDNALMAVGPELGSVLTDVCCFLKGLETVERERRWPPRSAKLMLRTGLDLLSRHYGTKAGT